MRLGQQVADQADVQGFPGAERLSRQGDFHGVGGRHRPQQQLYPTGCRKGRVAHLRQTEGGGVGSDAQVTLQRQLQTTAQACTIDGGDDRLPDLQVAEVEQSRVAALLGFGLAAFQRCGDKTGRRTQ
ncbi:hypothetical protein D3C76_1106130 [compost metagenome]